MAKWFSSGDLNAVAKFGKFLAILKLVISEPSIGDANSARVFAAVGGYKKEWNFQLTHFNNDKKAYKFPYDSQLGLQCNLNSMAAVAFARCCAVVALSPLQIALISLNVR